MSINRWGLREKPPSGLHPMNILPAPDSEYPILRPHRKPNRGSNQYQAAGPAGKYRIHPGDGELCVILFGLAAHLRTMRISCPGRGK